MVKKVISTLLCVTVMFASVTAAFSVSGNSTAEAAKVYNTPYYYNQLSDAAKSIYKTLRAAVMDCDKSVKVKFDKDLGENDLQQVAELLVFHDPMTFNLDDISVSSTSSDTATFKLVYRYKKETYDKMTAAYKKETQEVLELLTDDMSTYKKIRTIHDYIVNNTDYDLESSTNDTVYGTLVKNKAKCDGYAKTFSYICGQAGIRTVTVIGNYKYEDSGTMHMWNKVYYNKNWYNVDVTWDDPVGNIMDNLQYDFFMVSDEDLKNTHREENFSFEVPAANDSTRDYYDVNKKCADDYNSAISILKKGVNSAASNGKTSVYLKCSSKEVFDKMKEYILDNEKMHSVLKSAKDNKNSKLVPELYLYGFNEDQYILNIHIFYKNTALEDYFIDPDELDSESLKKLEKVGIT